MKTKHRTASKAKRIVRDDLAVYRTVSRMSMEPLTQQEQLDCSVSLCKSWELIRTGNGTGNDLCALSDAVSICVMASEDIDPFLEETSIAAAQAVCAIADRYARVSRIGVDAASLRDIPPALDFYKELLRTATAGQLFGWMQKVLQAREGIAA